MAKKKPAKPRKPAAAKKRAAKKPPAKLAAKPKRKPPNRSAAGIAAERERKATAAANLRSDAANIGQIPEIPDAWPKTIKNPPKLSPKKLREKCRTDMVLWHTDVFPHTTGLKPFGQVQLDSIEVSRRTILEGGLLQKLEPRRYGKTSRTINEVLHSLFYGIRKFVAVCGANTTFATQIFDGITLELEGNPILRVMFPEVMYPIEMLGGKGQIKANTQHIDGALTNMTWGSDEVTLPSVAGSQASGATVQVRPISGVRGMFKRVLTEFGVATIRPDLYLLDDIQTDKSAKSELMTQTLMDYIERGCIFGSDVSNPATIINLATMIRPGDLTDRIAKNPAWVTVRYAMLTKRATKAAEKFWFGPYAKAKRDYRRYDGDPLRTLNNKKKAAKKALALYRKNRKKADAGAVATWKWAFPWNAKDGACISTIQFAYDLIIDFGESVFASEAQNKPLELEQYVAESTKPTEEQLREAIITIPRGIVPADMPRLVVYFDVHKRLFYWVAMAKNLTTQRRHIVDYNTWPEQPDDDFTLENSRVTIPQMFPGLGNKALAQKAVGVFLTRIAGRRWSNQQGQAVRLSEIRCDANWGGTTHNVRKAVLSHAANDITWTCHGVGRNEKQTGFDEWARKTGEEKGYAHIRKEVTDHGTKQLDIETNIWKTETNLAWTTSADQDGTLTIFDEDDRDHTHFFKHMLIESCEPKAGRRDIEIFENPKGGQNHWWDCTVGAMVDSDKADDSQGDDGNNFFFGAR